MMKMSDEPEDLVGELRDSLIQVREERRVIGIRVHSMKLWQQIHDQGLPLTAAVGSSSSAFFGVPIFFQKMDTQDRFSLDFE